MRRDLGQKSLREKIIELIESAGPSGVSQREIVLLTGASKGYVSDLIDELEKTGVVVRYRGPGKTTWVRHARYAHPARGGYFRIGIVRSTEYLFLPHMIRLLRDRGLRGEVVYYENVFEVARSLSRGEIHAGMIPVYTQIAFRGLGAPLKSVGAGAVGGGYLVSREPIEDLAAYERVRVYSSHLSTMEVLSHTVMRSSRIPYEIVYYRTTGEALERVERLGRGEVVSLWEPYVSEVSGRGLLRIPHRDVVGDYHCCTLAIHESLVEDMGDYIKRVYTESLIDVKRDVERHADVYSVMIGVEREVVRRGVASYEFLDYIDRAGLERILSIGGGYLVSREYLEGLFID